MDYNIMEYGAAETAQQITARQFRRQWMHVQRQEADGSLSRRDDF